LIAHISKESDRKKVDRANFCTEWKHRRIFIFITEVVPEILGGVSREQVTEATQSVIKPQ
jgi:hypothetical protein